MYTEIDIATWPRRATYEFFKDYEDPFFNLTANVDVTNLCKVCKERELSFSLTVLYCSLIAANAIREFRIRLVYGKLIEFDRIEATQTILNDDETFSFAYFAWQPTVEEFSQAGREATARYKLLKTFDVETERQDLIYYSVIPWVAFTSFKHASRADRTQTVPRIVFGKAFETGGRRLMPVSVEANHAIMDGFHVGKFYEGLQKEMDSL